jgi:RNA polymerase sigma-70 factor (ECF subfamily)
MTAARVPARAAPQPADDRGQDPCDDDETVINHRSRLDELYREHSSRLVGRLTRQTGCREAAVELAQEAFAKMLRMTPARLRGLERPEAYLRRVAANLLNDWGRARASADRSSADLRTMADDVQIDQVAILESRDTLRRLEIAMSKLKPRTRAIFLAHRLDGLSYAEIAERTGLTVWGVEKQMGKAIAKIDRLLDRS